MPFDGSTEQPEDNREVYLVLEASSNITYDRTLETGYTVSEWKTLSEEAKEDIYLEGITSDISGYFCTEDGEAVE
jgi:hypothetical protein